MTLFLDLWNTNPPPQKKVSFPFWDNTYMNKLWVARMKYKKKMDWNSSRWVTSYFCSLFFCKERQKESKKNISRSSYCLRVVCDLDGRCANLYLPSSDCRTPWLTWASAASAQTEWNLSAFPRWLWAPALWLWSASFEVNDTHTHRAEWGLSKAVWAFHPLENRFRTHYNQRFGSQLFTVCLSTGYCCCCCCCLFFNYYW